MLEKGLDCAVFDPSARCNGVEDLDNTGVDEEGDTETFGVLEFNPLIEIEHGETCSHDKK